MAIEVIGAGFGRTGTMSLKVALEQLGHDRCYHMIELLQNPEHVVHWEAAARGERVDWDALFAGYRATVDFPGCSFYRPLMERYPDARVVLTVRDSGRWYASARDTIYRAGPPLGERLAMMLRLPFSARLRRMVRVFRLIDRMLWQQLFSGRFEDEAYARKVFEEHNEEVERLVPADRLLVYEVSQGWGPLCAFLGVPVPDEPFPRLNDRAQFQAQAKNIKALLRG